MHASPHGWRGNGRTPPPRSAAAEEVTLALRGTWNSETGKGMAHCPAHDDRTPSLSVTDGDDGRVLVHCHANCAQDAVLDAIQSATGISLRRPRLPTQAEREKRSIAGREPMRKVRLRRSAKKQRDRRRVTILPEKVREAIREYNSAAPATAGNAYLAAKKILPHPCLHENENGDLLIPAYRDGRIVNVQRVPAQLGGIVKRGAPGTADGGYRLKPKDWPKFWPELLEGEVSDLAPGASFCIEGTTETIVVAEGLGAASACHEATGWQSRSSFGTSNLEAAARKVREEHQDAEIVIAGDNDPPGIKAAVEAAMAVGGLVAMPKTPGFDFNDLQQKGGLPAVRVRLNKAEAPEPDDNDIIDQLVAINRASPIEYDRKRKTVAAELGVSVGALDREIHARCVAAVREERAADAQGTPVVFEDVVPAAEPQDGAELLSDLTAAVHRYVIQQNHADTTAALFVVYSYLFDRFDIAPLLAVLSPEPRCGKTTLMRFLLRTCARPLQSSNITPAVLFRSIEKFRPTLLIDEADSFLKMREELRGVLNSGHEREFAYVMRSVGDNHEPTTFHTFGPKAVAMIGRLPLTLADRSIAIHLRRKLTSERVRSMRTERAKAELLELRSRVVRFAADHSDDIASSIVKAPRGLNDRQRDNWRPLLAIARLAGKAWLGRARAAAVALSHGNDDDDGDSIRVLLLRDLRLILESESHPVSSARVLTALHSIADRPWGEYRDGEPLTPRQLADLLRPFGIKTSQIGRGPDRTLRGYELDGNAADAFERYAK